MDKLIAFRTSSGEKWAVPMAIVHLVTGQPEMGFIIFPHEIKWEDLEAYAVKLQDASTLDMAQEWAMASPIIETAEDLSESEKAAFAVVLARAKATIHNKPLEI